MSKSASVTASNVMYRLKLVLTVIIFEHGSCMEKVYSKKIYIQLIDRSKYDEITLLRAAIVYYSTCMYVIENKPTIPGRSGIQCLIHAFQFLTITVPNNKLDPVT